MENIGELGSGTSGHVVKMRHKPTNYIMAVKVLAFACLIWIRMIYHVLISNLILLATYSKCGAQGIKPKINESLWTWMLYSSLTIVRLSCNV